MSTTKKRIWLINQYASTPKYGMGGRHYYIARELSKRGYDVYLISGSFGHKQRQPQTQNTLIAQTREDGFVHVKIKTLSYSSSFSKKRILNWFLFSMILGYYIRVKFPRPDAVVYSSPSLIGFLGARRLTRKLNVPLTFEVRDIWPMTLIHLGGYSPRHPFIRFMQWIEDRAYKEADHVVSNLKNADKHIQVRGGDRRKFIWIPNGFSLDEVSSPEPLSEAVLQKLPQGKFIVGYTGAHGVANALDTLLNAAQALKDNEGIAFVLVGQGREKRQLQRIAEEKKLSNVIFIDPVAKVQIQSILSKFSACYLGLVDEKIFSFGVSPNKLFDYMVSGRPIIYAVNSGDYKPVDDAGCGISVPAGNIEKLVSAILQLKTMPLAQREQMGMRGYQFALSKHEYGTLAEKIADIILL